MFAGSDAQRIAGAIPDSWANDGSAKSDVLYLFPVAAMYPDTTGWLPFWQVLVFIAVLFAAIFYFSSKGVFTWPRRIRVSPRR